MVRENGMCITTEKGDDSSSKLSRRDISGCDSAPEGLPDAGDGAQGSPRDLGIPHGLQIKNGWH